MNTCPFPDCEVMISADEVGCPLHVKEVKEVLAKQKKPFSNGTCRACGAPMLWVEMLKSGKKNPLDPVPVKHGNIIIVGDGKAEAVSKNEPAAPGELLYVSHYVTCPEAKKFRRPK
jgi:hypothetical protein